MCFGQYIWCCIRDCFVWTSFRVSISKFGCLEGWVFLRDRHSSSLQVLLGQFEGTYKMTIEKTFVVNPDTVYSWEHQLLADVDDLLKKNDRRKMATMTQSLLSWMNMKKKAFWIHYRHWYCFEPIKIGFLFVHNKNHIKKTINILRWSWFFLLLSYQPQE